MYLIVNLSRLLIFGGGFVRLGQFLVSLASGHIMLILLLLLLFSAGQVNFSRDIPRTAYCLTVSPQRLTVLELLENDKITLLSSNDYWTSVCVSGWWYGRHEEES